MLEFNENHQRKLLVTCQYVDEMLTEALWRIESRVEPSPLRKYITDATPAQINSLQQQMMELRQTMVIMLRENNIAIPDPEISALWAFRTALIEAADEVFELQTRLMTSYGPLSSEARKTMDDMAMRLMQQIETFTRVFDQITRPLPHGDH
ncbi:MAG: hypothetical protein M0Z50_10680 [Planctomycetia bacterium]|nr:hypothetical protein [Planctomycetia bacterium]